MKKILILITTIILVISCTACESSEEQSGDKGIEITDSKSSTKYGNTMGNLQNGGKVTTDGEYIYYDTDSGIEKCSVDGGEATMVFSDEGASINTEFLNVMDGWVYFVKTTLSGDSRGIWKVTTEGEHLECIWSSDAERSHIKNLIVDEEWIYFVESSSDLNFDVMYRMNIEDNSIVESVYSGDISHFNMEDGYVYIYNPIQGEISKFNPEDVANIEEVYDFTLEDDSEPYELEQMIVQDGVIYYSVYGEGIYSINDDGSGNKLVLSESQMTYSNRYTFNTDGEYIYISLDSGDTVYRVGINGDDYSDITDSVEVINNHNLGDTDNLDGFIIYGGYSCIL